MLERTDALGASGGDPERRALLLLAVDFWTWQRLAGEGLDDERAARLMAATVVLEGART